MRWRELDEVAIAAEARLKDIGQLSADPDAAALVEAAFEKRRVADACLLRLLRSPQQHPRAANDAQTGAARITA